MLKLVVIVTLVLLLPVATLAETYSLVDEQYLPLRTINDPTTHKREPITRYSYEQLDAFLWHSPNFLSWNDGSRVCESMLIMFGRRSDRCMNLPKPRVPRVEPKVFVLPNAMQPVQRSTSTATVGFTISPAPYYQRSRQRVVMINPVYVPYRHIYYPYWR